MQESYLYANSSAVALSSKLLTHEKILRLAECDSVEEGFKLLLEAGFADTYRSLHPDLQGYSWWSYRAGARARNVGWRIDYFIVSKRVMPWVRMAAIYPEIEGSDHCPVGMELAL